MNDKLKGLALSKTAWFGFVVAVVGFLQAQSSFFQNVLPEQYFGYFTAALGAAVIALRWVTSTPLEEKVKRRRR